MDTYLHGRDNCILVESDIFIKLWFFSSERELSVCPILTDWENGVTGQSGELPDCQPSLSLSSLQTIIINTRPHPESRSRGVACDSDTLPSSHSQSTLDLDITQIPKSPPDSWTQPNLQFKNGKINNIIILLYFIIFYLGSFRVFIFCKY